MRKPLDPTIVAMIDDAKKDADARCDRARRVSVAQIKVARALGRLPTNYARRKALRAAAIMLDCPIMGDGPNQ